MDSPIVTLTTDWGDRDFFAGRVKGRLMSSIPGVRLVDITHGIDPYQVTKAIFVVKNACLDFPAGTIHIIDVNSTETSKNPFVVVEFRGQYYICTDNGLPYAVFGDEVTKAVMIDVSQESSFFTFAAYELFCKVAAMIANGAQLSDIGPEVDELNKFTPYRPVEQNGRLKLAVTYVDSYGNAYLNITYDEFERVRNGRAFELKVRETPINSISTSYLDVDPKKVLLTVSSLGYLQVAVSLGSAEQLFGMIGMREVYVRFL